MNIELTLNGRRCAGDALPGESLLDLLRGTLGDTSPKRGCAPLGQCGSCLALVNGAPATLTVTTTTASIVQELL